MDYQLHHDFGINNIYGRIYLKLKDWNWKASKYDTDILLLKELVVIYYVGDLGIQASKKKIMYELIGKLERKGFDLITLQEIFLNFWESSIQR